jgi:hypothetical protein
MIAALYQQVEADANAAHTEVLRRLLLLHEGDPGYCRKHTSLRAAYTQAAINRHHARKRMGLHDLSLVLVTANCGPPETHPAEARWQDLKQQYHAAPCYCDGP